MSSADHAIAKTVRAEAVEHCHRAPWSLAARLTGCFIISAFSRVLIGTASLYWALVNCLLHADDEILLNKVHVLYSLLSAPQPDETVIAQEIGEDVNAPRRIYVRVISVSGAVIHAPSGMEKEASPEAFPSASNSSMRSERSEKIRGADRRFVRILSRSVLYTRSRTAREMIVQVATDVTSDEEFLARYKTNLAMVLGGAFLAGAGAGYQIVRAGLRPMHRIARAAEDIGASSLNKRLD